MLHKPRNAARFSTGNEVANRVKLFAFDGDGELRGCRTRSSDPHRLQPVRQKNPVVRERLSTQELAVELR